MVSKLTLACLDFNQYRNSKSSISQTGFLLDLRRELDAIVNCKHCKRPSALNVHSYHEVVLVPVLSILDNDIGVAANLRFAEKYSAQYAMRKHRIFEAFGQHIGYICSENTRKSGSTGESSESEQSISSI